MGFFAGALRLPMGGSYVNMKNHSNILRIEFCINLFKILTINNEKMKKLFNFGPLINALKEFELAGQISRIKPLSSYEFSWIPNHLDPNSPGFIYSWIPTCQISSSPESYYVDFCCRRCSEKSPVESVSLRGWAQTISIYNASLHHPQLLLLL